MRVRVGDEVRTGRAIDLRRLDADVDPATVAKAVRGEAVGSSPVAVECPDPGPVHDHVGLIDASVTVSLRVALADAARSRGHAAPQADEIEAVRDRLDDLDPPAVDLQTARKRVADASDVEVGLRERVATLQGRVQALRETGDAETADPEGDDSDEAADAVESAEADLADATRRLSEVQTERIAAEQALARAREQARQTRATRRERLRLEDRAGNLRREARDHLAGVVRESFEKSRDDAPAELDPPVRTALSVARVAALDAPVVLAFEADGFESPTEAARWLDAPVVRV